MESAKRYSASLTRVNSLNKEKGTKQKQENKSQSQLIVSSKDANFSHFSMDAGEDIHDKMKSIAGKKKNEKLELRPEIDTAVVELTDQAANDLLTGYKPGANNAHLTIEGRLVQHVINCLVHGMDEDVSLRSVQKTPVIKPYENLNFCANNEDRDTKSPLTVDSALWDFVYRAAATIKDKTGGMPPGGSQFLTKLVEDIESGSNKLVAQTQFKDARRQPLRLYGGNPETWKLQPGDRPDDRPVIQWNQNLNFVKYKKYEPEQAKRSESRFWKDSAAE